MKPIFSDFVIGYNMSSETFDLSLLMIFSWSSWYLVHHLKFLKLEDDSSSEELLAAGPVLGQ